MYGIIALMERRPGKLYFLEVEGFCKPPYIFFEGVFYFFPSSILSVSFLLFLPISFSQRNHICIYIYIYIY